MSDTKYEIYMGLNHRESGKDFDFEKVRKSFMEAFSKYKINFSLNKQTGGYIHEDGTYVLEEGIKITCIGKRSKKQETEFFNDLKTTFGQESVLVIKREINADFVGGK